MIRRTQFALVLAVTLLATGLPVLAQDRADSPTTQPPAMSPMNNGPMQDMGPMGMMNMMRMMSNCPMMGGNMAGMGMTGMPVMPPGNEKLQLQMQAEMMQKKGEILAKYASRVHTLQK